MSTGYRFYLLEGEDIAAVRVCDASLTPMLSWKLSCKPQISRRGGLERTTRIGMLSKPAQK
jgi:hypothetical protein